MAIRKKKHLEKVVFSLNLDTVFENERNVSENRTEALKIIQKIVCADDGKEQMALFREVETVLLRKQNDPVIVDMAVSLLGQMFYQINSRSTLKRTVSSVLQGLAVIHPTLVSKTLADNLKTVISISSEIQISHIKDTTEQMLTLCDNFPVGKLTIDENHLLVLKYISFSMSKLLQNICSENSPQQTSDLYNVCQSTLKLLNLIFQQCSGITKHSNTESKFYLEAILACVNDLLNDQFTLLNCRINAGIAFSLLLRNVCNKDSYFAYVKHNGNLGDFNVPQNVRKFPAISQLCVWSGVMAVLSVNELISAETDCLLFGEILNEIIRISGKEEDTVIISSSARALLQWLDVAAQMLNSDHCTENIKEKFSETAATTQVLLQYVWTNWEHFMDCVQYHTRDIFRRVIALNVRSQNIDPKECSFLKHLCCSLLEMPWHRRGKYSMLCCLAEHLGSTVFIQLHPSLADDLYHALCDASLASHVSELCDVMFKSSNHEYDKYTWENVWLRPLIHVMCNATKPQKCGLTEHILPKLFTIYPQSVNFLVSELSAHLTVQTENCFSALIACGKVAQKCGVYKSSNEHCDLWCGCIPKEVLESALCHVDDQVRLSAFSLICDSPRTTECITTNEFDLLKTSLPLNINIQCPAFRQQFVSFVKKFLLRIKGSAYTFLKKAKLRKDETDVQKCVEEYQEFLLWLKNFLFFCLHPNANFPRRVTALSLLSLCCNIFSTSEAPCQFEVLVTQEHQAQTLLEAMKDTYENNKQQALDILLSAESRLLNFQNKQRVQDIFEAGLLLASSTRPPDSVTASFIFALLTQHDLFSVVIENMMALKGSEFSFSKEITLLNTNHEKDVSLAVICVLCIHLDMHLNTAKNSLLEAAAKCPLYGVLICIRKILSGLQFSSISVKSSIQQWQIIFSRLISLCFEVVSLVEPVVCNSSPEGHLPMDTNPESIKQLQEAVQNAISGRYQNVVVNTDSNVSSSPSIDLVKTKAVTAQMLLLCSWRSHKEVSLLLGWISENVPISDPHEESDGMLSVSQIVDMGHFFIRQLCVLKHRGGFEQAYVGFCKLCHRLWRSSIRDLHKLPQEWLQHLFSTIHGEEEGIHLCPNRRSAGLPFIFQALLVSELDVTGSSCFKQAMTTLIDLAQPHVKKYSLECRVHAVNVLRALYRDSCLGESVMSYASEGLKIAISGFQAVSWSVRNAATLLFSTLMTRVFGVNRSRDEVQRKNCMTGRVFFFRFPDLFEFLLNELKSCVVALSTNPDNTASSLQPSLYPILLLLGRLYPSTIEGSDSNLKLTEFVPYLRQCVDSAVWKTRILAAKALVPLLSSDEYSNILDELFSSLPTLFLGRQQNHVHGVLLQILYILKEVPHLPVAQQTKIKKMLPTWVHSYLWLSQRCNPCYATRAAFMEIVYFSLTENVISVDPSSAGITLKDLFEEIKTLVCPPGKVQFIVLSVYVSLLSLLQQSSTESFFADICSTESYTLEHFIIDLLESPFYEARIVTLQFLLWITDSTMDYVNSYDFVLLKNINWSVPSVSQEKKIKLKNLVGDSRNISTCLVSVLMSETHPGCLIRVYQLMFVMYNAGGMSWISLPFKAFATCVEKLHWVLNRFLKCKNDDVKNAMLLFSSSLSKLVYNALLEDFSVHNHEILVKWMTELEKSAVSDQSIARRSAAVQVLKHIRESVLMDTHGILGHSPFRLWQAFLHLLEDDEPDIKRMASEIIISIRNTSNNDLPVYGLPVVPAKAVDLLITLFIERFSQSIPSECFSMLIGWMLRSEGEELEFQGDEQPFDKGEMNVFVEDFALTVLVREHLLGFLRLHKKPEELKILVSLVPSWKSCCHSDKLEYMCIAECLKRCLQDTLDLVKKFTSSSDCSPFINRHFDHTSLRISQHVEVVSILIGLCSPAVQSECRPCLEHILQMLKTIKYVNRFLSDIIHCIDETLNSFKLST